MRSLLHLRGNLVDLAYKIEYDEIADDVSAERNGSMPRAWIQLLAIMLLAIALYLVLDFSQRVVTSVQLSANEQQYEREVAREEARKATLVKERARVQTDQFVEDEMREQGWIRPGETRVRPLITPAATPAASAPKPAAPAPPTSLLEKILSLLFGP
jgi:cell division protein FtsB